MSKCTCPVCKGTAARWKPMVNGRVCITCTAPGCGVQIFARSDDADELMRDRFIQAIPNVTNGAQGEDDPERNVTNERSEIEEGAISVWG